MPPRKKRANKKSPSKRRRSDESDGDAPVKKRATADEANKVDQSEKVEQSDQVDDEPAKMVALIPRQIQWSLQLTLFR
jgi:hypothetical protein